MSAQEERLDSAQVFKKPSPVKRLQKNAPQKLVSGIKGSKSPAPNRETTRSWPSIKLFTCPWCEYCSEEEHQFRGHASTHMTANPLTCSFCPYVTFRWEELNDHLVQNHKEKHKFKCNQSKKCMYTAPDTETLVAHTRYHKLGLNYFSCRFCGIYNFQAYPIMKHVMNCSKAQSDCQACEGTGDEHNCELDDQTEDSFEMPPESEQYSCTLCLFRSNDFSVLLKHIIAHTRPSSDSRKTPVPSEPFSCPHCTYRCGLLEKIREHMLIHDKNNLYKCPHCSFRTRCNNEFRSHKSSHTELKSFPCTICGARFARSDQLLAHVKITHRLKQLFACPKCDYKAQTKLKLNAHRKTHETSAPIALKCHLCPRVFNSDQALGCHLKFHSKTEPYLCTLCDFECYEPEELKQHIQSHVF